MIKKFTFGISFLFINLSHGPPNCNLFKSNPNCFNACMEAEQAILHAQGSKTSQEHFDKSIALCPEFDYSHYEKAVPYAKRGLMREWKIMIDRAVELNPTEHLGTRGWYHFFFMHNYKAAIDDIEYLDHLLDYDIGSTGDNMYHLNVMKALCWKGLSKPRKAIEIIESHMATEDYYPGLYDNLHLGVLYLEMGETDSALEYLEKQISEYDLSEVYYYKALCYKALAKGEAYKSNLKKALEYYERGEFMSNSYREMVDEIYLVDIQNEMKAATLSRLSFIPHTMESY